jgi:hypothetical protein
MVMFYFYFKISILEIPNQFETVISQKMASLIKGHQEGWKLFCFCLFLSRVRFKMSGLNLDSLLMPGHQNCICRSPWVVSFFILGAYDRKIIVVTHSC